MATETGPSGDGLDNVDADFSNMSLNTKDYEYKMDHKKRGRFVIINNKTFLPKTEIKERRGTDVDAGVLFVIFRKLGFDVTVVHNQTTGEMLQLMIEEGAKDHRDCDAFGCAVLTHGDDDVLWGTDDIIAIDKFVAPIKGCRTLVGKPKLFFFQACRGNEFDSGVEAHDDPTDDRYKGRIPVEADCLYAYSTVPGFFSWRNSTDGSWFVQAFNWIMENPESRDMEFVRVLTRVSHVVAYQFESKAAKDKAYMNRKKQVPSIVSMLTKDLYLKPKN